MCYHIPSSRARCCPDTCGFLGVVGGETFKCPACKAAWYCGVEYQKADWKKHKPLCGKMAMARKKEKYGK